MNIETIIAACAAHGLEITDVRSEGMMLQLVPSNKASLPGAQQLSELSEHLREITPPIRWVTLVIEQSDE